MHMPLNLMQATTTSLLRSSDAQHDHSARTWKIGEIASDFGVTLRTLRFYEDKALVEPERVGTRRVYHGPHRAKLAAALFGKRIGLPLSDVRSLLDMRERGDTAGMRTMLDRQRDALLARRDEIDLTLSEIDEQVQALA